jgi:hypothetical protein
MTHLLVAVDKFTKWIEAKPIKKLDGSTSVTLMRDVILRYGYPHNIITDNESNFTKGVFARFYSQSGIRLDIASVAHPQANCQVERANGLVLAGIKPRLIVPLERSPGCWLDRLSAVLWSLRTTPNRSTGYMPFFLVYGAEAIIPANVEFDSPRVTQYNEEDTEEALQDSVDLLEEARNLAASRSVVYQQDLHRYHSRRIHPLAFREGNLVICWVQGTKGRHKLSPPWESPFISRALHNNAYDLIDTQKAWKDKIDRSNEETKHPWNASLLRPFYT